MPKTNWIWMKDYQEKVQDDPILVYFRKSFQLKKEVTNYKIKISADTRYKLYVNGTLAEFGPIRGDDKIWFYDEVEIGNYLTTGKNILAVEVLRYPVMHGLGNHGMFRTNTPGLFIQAEEIQGENISGDQNWKYLQSEHFKIQAESETFSPLMFLEDCSISQKENGWKLAEFDDSSWEHAQEYHPVVLHAAASPGNLQQRNIPSMLKIPRQFQGLVPKEQKDCDPNLWNGMLSGQNSLVIPANTTISAEINAGELTCGFLSLRFKHGKDAKIEILTSEGYVQNETGLNPWIPKKADRCDWTKGYLHGFTDHYQAGGYGAEACEVYEPFWYRTFRFIKLTITTKDELELCGFDYLETGYPLEVKASVETSDETLAPVWGISLRTLKRCMHETYIDCPFYEQLQYAMDSRSEILYTYLVSADDRLARQCMDAFRRSQRADGMINCSYPSTGPNVIPGFSIYYIMMVYDHMMYFGDRELVHQHAGAIDQILQFFHNNLEERGLVGKVGGPLFQDKYWSFIDWTMQWNETVGMPQAGLNGPITMESLLYIMGLQAAAGINDYIGRTSTAEEYGRRAEEVQTAVKRYCLDDKGFYTDGPGILTYSQHCQVFALLTDTADLQQGKENLLTALYNTEKFAPCSVAMAFYLFRACEKAGIYEETKHLWDIWRKMTANNLTTCVENDVDERSDCHAWGSLILYELPAIVLGVSPAAPGFEQIRIAPNPGYLDWAKGSAMTKWGLVQVEWKKEDHGEVKLSYQAPEGITVITETVK